MYYYNGVEWIELAVSAPEECGVCMIWSSEEGQCVSLPAGTKDENCSATHYACGGNGNCTAPKSTSGNLEWRGSSSGSTFYQECVNRGYDGCYSVDHVSCVEGDEATLNCSSVTPTCSPEACGPYRCAYYKCWNWVYD